MDYGTPQAEECFSIVSLTFTGKGVSRIRRVLSVSILAWALLWFPSRIWNRALWPWVQLRHNIFLLVMLPKKLYGFRRCSLIYFIWSWSMLSFIVKTIVVSTYQRILCFMTTRNTLRWGITMSVRWCSRDLLAFGIYRLTSRPHMCRWSLSTYKTSLVWWRMILSLRGSVEA